ncbi:MAG: hypothetical protein QOI65_1640 [Thermoleophilaceae bacterium]|nr:hypothetical protein [Thermoleophilaceae bacterium]
MSDPPDLTVLMPVRDYRADYLHAAVDSLLAQSSPDWRLVIVADGPGTAELGAVLDPRCHDPRIELVDSDGQRLAAALNTGMRHASTDFVAILFGDDLWDPHAVAVLTRAIHAHPEVDFFHSARRFVADDGTPISDVMPSRRGVTLNDFGTSSPVGHLMCWRRSMGLAVGGIDESLDSVGPDDFDFPWTMAEHGAAFRDVPECLYVVRDHRSYFRLTTHLPRSVHQRATRRIMRKHGVGRLETERFLRAARRGYLRQCLYRSPLDRWLRERARIGRTRAWCETYPLSAVPASEPLHLVEVGVAWPPDTFLRHKLVALAQGGVRITVVASPGPASDSGVPGIDVVRLPDTSARLPGLAIRAAADCLRLALADRRRLRRVLRAVAGLSRPRRPRERLVWLRVFAQLEPLRPAVVHFEWESAAIRYLPLIDLWRCPMVMSCHGGLDLYTQTPGHRQALTGLAKAFERAAVVHCVSDAMCAEAARHGLDPSKARVIRSGVELGLFTPPRA